MSKFTKEKVSETIKKIKDSEEKLLVELTLNGNKEEFSKAADIWKGKGIPLAHYARRKAGLVVEHNSFDLICACISDTKKIDDRAEILKKIFEKNIYSKSLHYTVFNIAMTNFLTLQGKENLESKEEDKDANAKEYLQLFAILFQHADAEYKKELVKHYDEKYKTLSGEQQKYMKDSGLNEIVEECEANIDKQEEQEEEWVVMVPCDIEGLIRASKKGNVVLNVTQQNQK